MPIEEAFVVTVGVPHHNKDVHCKRVLTVLEQAGYVAGPTSDDSILELARQVELTHKLKENS